MSRRLVYTIVFLVGHVWGALAAEPQAGPVLVTEDLAAGPEAVVEAVIDGDTVVLADGGIVRLAGIAAPKPPLGRPVTKPWPVAVEATRALDGLARGARVRLYYVGGRDEQRMDRHGRHLAQLVRGDGLWLQGALLGRGLARVEDFHGAPGPVADMLAIEARARDAGVGIWRHYFYRVRDHREAGKFIGTFQLVEGVVFAVARQRNRTYINFSGDWRTDFTIVLSKKTLRLFKRAAIDPEDFAGRPVRVRGWVESWNGPAIKASHPGQIELLSGLGPLAGGERNDSR